MIGVPQPVFFSGNKNGAFDSPTVPPRPPSAPKRARLARRGRHLERVPFNLPIQHERVHPPHSGGCGEPVGRGYGEERGRVSSPSPPFLPPCGYYPHARRLPHSPAFSGPGNNVTRPLAKFGARSETPRRSPGTIRGRGGAEPASTAHIIPRTPAPSHPPNPNPTNRGFPKFP